jgi:hypothetical protein
MVITAIAAGVSTAGWLFRASRTRMAVSAAVLLVVFVTAVFSTVHIASQRSEFAAYASAWARFDQQMVQSRADGIASIHLSTADLNANNWSRLNALGDNPRFWVNQCVSDYYGVKVLSTTP